MFKFVQHLIVQDDGMLPSIPDCLYAYILAGNGVFLYARRDDLEVLIRSHEQVSPVCAHRTIFEYATCTGDLIASRLASSKENMPNEILFWFNFDRDRQLWSLDAPLQFCRPASVFPMDKADPLGTRH